MPFLVINGLEVPVADQKAAKDNIRVGDNRDRMFSGELRGTTRAFKKEWNCTTTPLKQDEALNLEGLLLGRGHYWSWDNDLYSTGKGLPPIGTPVATLRPGEGKFGGAVAVTEGTENLIPLNRQKFEGWTAYQDAQVTITQDISVPEWGTDQATRIQTNGGTSTIKYVQSIVGPSVDGQDYSLSVRIKNIGSKSVVISTNLGYVTETVAPGESKYVKLSTIGNGIIHFQCQFQVENIADSLDFIAYQPMAEEKSFSTPFVEGTRAAGILSYPDLAPQLNQRQFTFAGWWRPYLGTGKSVGDVNNRFFHTDTGTTVIGRRIAFYRVADNQGLRFAVPNAAGTNYQQYTFTPSYAANEWHFLAVVLDVPNMKCRIHLNDEFQEFNLVEEPALLDLQRFFLGCAGTGGQLNGLLDETHILPYAITIEQYNALRTLTQPASPLPRLNVWGSMVNRTEDNPMICIGEIEGSDYRQFMRGGWNTAGEEIRFRLREV